MSIKFYFKPLYLLLIVLIVALYFALLFVNASYGFFSASSPVTVIVELITIPAILLTLAILLYSIWRIVAYHYKSLPILISSVISLTLIVCMFLVE